MPTTKENTLIFLLNLIVWLIILGLIWYLVTLLPIPAPISQIIRVLFLIIVILVVLGAFGLIDGFNLPRVKLPQ